MMTTMTEEKMHYLGVCDKFRKKPNGEATWQQMMATRIEITEEEFLEKCDVSHVLDEDETWEEYRDACANEHAPISFFTSCNGLVHFQTTGFEFIWGPHPF